MSYKRLSQSLCSSYSSDYSPPLSTFTPTEAEVEVWVNRWQYVLAKGDVPDVVV